MMPNRNMHAVDGVVRLLLGAACIYIGFFNQTIIYNNVLSILLGLFGLVNVVSAMLSYCPVYGLAGFSTYHTNDDND